VPFILTGLRLGVGRGLVGVIVGEMVASQAGIGFMMNRAGAMFQTDKVFVGVVILALFGWGLTALLEALERRFDSWRPRR
jgi:NitT/TauT family transport system permease protein